MIDHSMRGGLSNATAFPSSEEQTYGLTVRQWLVGQALAGLLANPATMLVSQQMTPAAIAEGACNIADAVLARLAPPPDPPT